MGTVEITRFSSPDSLAQAAATQWLDQLGRIEPDAAPYCVALAGGRIAGRFFRAAAQSAKARGANLEAVHFFWGDERCVPPDDADSNYKLAWDTLLGPLGVPLKRIHRVRGEDPPEKAAASATEELKRIARRGEQGQPLLDLVFLGIGEEGHTASLFPGEPANVNDSEQVYRVVTASPKPPPRRITLGYATLAAARQVWLLASGEGKEKVLRESLAPEGQTPCARVLRLRPHTRVLTDLLGP